MYDKAYMKDCVLELTSTLSVILLKMPLDKGQRETYCYFNLHFSNTTEVLWFFMFLASFTFFVFIFFAMPDWY